MSGCSSKVAQWIERLQRADALALDAVDDELRGTIRRLCAYYLLQAKRGKEPLDPVARFHLANGAQLARLNWSGDTSHTGLKRSFGLTVNYVYRLADVERNHEAYAKQYRVVASIEFRRLGREADQFFKKP